MLSIRRLCRSFREGTRVHRVLEGQVHYVAPGAIVPELLEFLITA